MECQNIKCENYIEHLESRMFIMYLLIYELLDVLKLKEGSLIINNKKSNKLMSLDTIINEEDELVIKFNISEISNESQITVPVSTRLN